MIAAANRAAAAEPSASVWVSASAGTGKTTVLTQRLLRLMLDGTDPSRILCLTFTRAAAAEMANRLDEVLGRWATLADADLAPALRELTGRHADGDLIARAQRLFALVLDTPGGVKISTIHAFCQTLLRRFPLEAGVAPEFLVIDERGADALLAEAAQSVIAAVRAGGDCELGEALATVAEVTAEERFGELVRALVQERGRLRRTLAGGIAALRRRLSEPLALPEQATLDSLFEGFCSDAAVEATELGAAAEALTRGSPTDREHALTLAAWCRAASPDRHDLLAGYEAVFLKQNGEIRERLCTAAAIRAAGCDLAAILDAEAGRVFRMSQARAGLVLREATCALVRFGGALLDAYHRAKRLRGVLDFDDLVTLALALLRRPGIAPWVLFKLDGGLDHILIDEAQDTNPEQWEIIAALAEEFFAGEGARAELRTVFAVGDVKQSIFSFQRADPHAFLRMRAYFEERVNSANRAWQVVPLELSFRSTEPVLRAVDMVFGRPEAQDGVALDGAPIRHVAERAGHAGLVELWPPVAPPAEDEADPDELPLVRRHATPPHARLARAIAARIAQWLACGERLPARGRAIRPGDVMVLVRRRNAFVGELLRALKQRGVPVAGADRLILTEQLAVQDLMALGRFLLLPEDDLSLAAVLKGPLFDIDEETLFELCHGRGEETLWSRVRAGAGSDPKLDRPARQLALWLARADFVPPYELYAEILGADGVRPALLRRLGPEAEDPIAEFLGSALAYEHDAAPSLQGFLRWLAAGETEVKRDFAARPRDEVRVLTVHGAKGLEAPIVFLPDTMAVPDQKNSLVWTDGDGPPLWKPPGDHVAAFYAVEKARWRARQMQEYRRLLYVGLTRAQDRLYICGWQTRNAPPSNCWHALCRAGLGEGSLRFDFDTTPLIGGDGWAGEGLRLESIQSVPPKCEPVAARALDAGGLPDWARRPAAAEPEPPRPLVPSRPADDEPAALSPVAAAGTVRFKRGLLVHRLLQGLPELPEAEREAAAKRFLALPVHGLAPGAQEEIARETLAVLTDPEFAPLFGPGSLAEVPVVGLVEGRALSGQIDRLVVTPSRVLIVDYKTAREPPPDEDGVPPIYLAQLRSYRAALARIYPDREICCVLLWTEGPRLMPISSDRLGG